MKSCSSVTVSGSVSSAKCIACRRLSALAASMALVEATNSTYSTK